MTFRDYLRDTARADTPQGDVARDVLADRAMAHAATYEEVRALMPHGATEAIKLLDAIRDEYERNR